MKERTVRIVWLFVGVLLGVAVTGIGALERIGGAYYHGQLTVLNQCSRVGISLVGNYAIVCEVTSLDEIKQDNRKRGESL